MVELENVEPENDDGVEKNALSVQPPEKSLSAFGGAFPELRIDSPVELVYFQGPHYGDRYGIAGTAVAALAQHDVPLLAVVCTGASVYLITPKGMASAARNALGKAFSIPGTQP
jgi:hypothetical protein